MAIDFPASPTNGQTHTVGSTTWTWDGTKWTITSGGAAGATDKIEEGNTSAEVIDTGSDGRFVVTTEGSERLRVKSNGDVQSQPSSSYDIQATTTGVSLRLQTTNTGTAVTDGCLLQMAADNNVYFYNKENAALVFGSNDTERMRITNAGRILHGAAAPTAENELFSFQGNNGTLSMFNVTGGASQWPIRTWNTASSGTINHILFMDGGGAARGSITTNGSSTAYNTTSDYRLKENIEFLTGATQRLSQIPVHRFNFVDSDARVDGFIAHEVQAIVPEAITGEKDAVDDDGNPVYQGIDQSKLVPLLTAALQEAVARIEAQDTTIASLEARLTALEGGN